MLRITDDVPVCHTRFTHIACYPTVGARMLVVYLRGSRNCCSTKRWIFYPPEIRETDTDSEDRKTCECQS